MRKCTMILIRGDQSFRSIYLVNSFPNQSVYLMVLRYRIKGGKYYLSTKETQIRLRSFCIKLHGLQYIVYTKHNYTQYSTTRTMLQVTTLSLTPQQRIPYHNWYQGLDTNLICLDKIVCQVLIQ